MKQFVIKILFFLIPLVLLFLFPVWILFESGEFLSQSQIESLQNKPGTKVLLGKAYVPSDAVSLVKIVQDKKPEVLVLGNSRVLQIRQEFFQGGVSFYNAGGSILTLADLNAFLAQLSYSPRVIIVGLEQSYFHTMWTKQTMTSTVTEPSSLTTEALLGIIKKVYLDFWAHKFSIADVLQKTNDYRAIGLNAVVHHNGLRNDGSYYYGKILQNPNDASLEDYHFQDTLQRIAKGERRFEHGQTVSPDAVEELKKFLKTCQERNIHVVAFLPPYAPTIWKTMHASEQQQNYQYIDALEPTLKQSFSERGFALSDFSNPTLFPRDSEFIDGFHGGEKVYATMLLSMASSSPIFGQVLSVSELQHKVEKTSQDLAVFPN